MNSLDEEKIDMQIHGSADPDPDPDQNDTNP